MWRTLAAFLLASSTVFAAESVEVLINAGRLAEARELLRERTAVVGKEPRTTFLEAMILHRENQHHGSLEKLASVEHDLGDDPDFLKLTGLNLVALEVTVPAGKYFQKAVQLAPKDAMARYYLGLWLLRTREPVAAEAEFRRSLVLNPDHLDTHFMLALSLDEQGRADDALAGYARAAELADKRGLVYPKPHLYAGRLLYTRRQFEESISRLRVAVAGDSESHEAWFALGKSLEQVGNLEEAEAAYLRCVALKKDERGARYRLLQIYARTSRPQAAEAEKKALAELARQGLK